MAPCRVTAYTTTGPRRIDVKPLTIILPTYNGASFLREQIDSILAQDDGDFDLLTIDDGSSDDSAAILDDYVRCDARVRRLPSSGNIGQHFRLRALLKASESPFVAFADQDDIWRPDRNRRLLAAIGDRAMAFGRSQLMDGAGRDLGRSISEEHGADPVRAGPLRTLFRSLAAAHASIVRRDLIDVATLAGPRPFDWVMTLEAMLSAGLVYVDEAVVMHRIHGGNQFNGAAIKTRPKLVSRQRLRQSTSFVGSDRLYFFLLIDQLSRSASLSDDVRRAFVRATHACRYVWYHPLDFRPGKGRRLEAELHRLLDRFARDADDLAAFTAGVASIVRPQLAPHNLARSVNQYFGLTE